MIIEIKRAGAKYLEHAAVVAEFVATAKADPDVDLVVSGREGHRSGLFLVVDDAVFGYDLVCLAVARDVLGNWSCVTETGKVIQFLCGSEVQ